MNSRFADAFVLFLRGSCVGTDLAKRERTVLFVVDISVTIVVFVVALLFFGVGAALAPFAAFAFDRAFSGRAADAGFFLKAFIDLAIAVVVEVIAEFGLGKDVVLTDPPLVALLTGAFSSLA